MNYKTDKELDKVEELIKVSGEIADGVPGVALKASLASAATGLVTGLGVLSPSLFPFMVASFWMRKRLKDQMRQRKEALLLEAIRTRDAVIKELSDKTKLAQERIDELTNVNEALQTAIGRLSQDLK